jgi:hypothetical protein
VGPDLVPVAELELPFDPDDGREVVGAGSPDGRFFASRLPDGRIQVWSVHGPVPLPELPEPQPFEAYRGAFASGALLRPPPWAPPPTPLAPKPAPPGLEGIDGPDLGLVAMKSFAPQSEDERLDLLTAIRLQDDDVQTAELRNQWFEGQLNGRVPPDVRRRLDDLIEARGLAEAVTAYRSWRQALPRSGHAFDLEACHLRAEESSLRLPRPPEGVQEVPPLDRGHFGPPAYGVVLRIDTEGRPRWVARVGDVVRDGPACFDGYRGRWQPARNAEGNAVVMCVVAGCPD